MEALDRLILGFGSRFTDVLIEKGVPQDQVKGVMVEFVNRLSIPLVIPAMPIQDAIDLASFLVETAVKFCTVQFARGDRRWSDRGGDHHKTRRIQMDKTEALLFAGVQR